MDQNQKISHLIESAYLALKEARDLLGPHHDASFVPQFQTSSTAHPLSIISSEGTIVQGHFDGQQMLGDDGKKYSVPANYASKSKLVEGDQLKLTIKHDGSFLFKQIGPIERKRVKGVLLHDDESDQYRVIAEGQSYRVLTASVTYFKGQPHDEVILLVPKDKPSTWAAVEHILKSSQPSTNGLHSSSLEPHIEQQPFQNGQAVSTPSAPAAPEPIDPLESTLESI